MPMLLAMACATTACQQPPARTERPPAPIGRGPVEERPVERPRPPIQHAQSFTLGESVRGRPIELYVFGEGGPTTLVIGGIHGNEPTSSDVAVELARYLQAHPEAYAGRCVMIAPAVNPDGLAARRRTNANGIDINRNFPAANFPRAGGARFAGGRRPLSEPETRAIMDAIEHARPAQIISIHSITRGRHGNNYDGPARALAEEMSRHNRYPVLPTMGYDTPGSLGSWAGVDRGIPIITLELPRDADGDACWRENRAALLAAIRSAGASAGVDPTLFGK
ncbi:MAG: murein peptide amidase A [Phycisphaerae bacterium]|jgi:predicted deacylase